MSTAIPQLDRNGLRRFGLVTGAIVGVLFGLLIPWLIDRPLPRWPFAIFLLLGVAGLVAPEGLRPVYTTWMRFGLLMSRVTTPLILGLLFFLFITPVARLRALRRVDTLARAPDKSAVTYRVGSKRAPSHRLEKPY